MSLRACGPGAAPGGGGGGGGGAGKGPRGAPRGWCGSGPGPWSPRGGGVGLPRGEAVQRPQPPRPAAAPRVAAENGGPSWGAGGLGLDGPRRRPFGNTCFWVPRPALLGVENSGQRGGGGGWCARRSAAVVPAPPPRPSAGLRVQVSRRRTRGEDREAEETARIGPGGCEGPWWRARVGNAWEASSETPGPSPHRVLHFGACRGSDMDRQGKWWVWDEGGDRNQREGGEMRLGAP